VIKAVATAAATGGGAAAKTSQAKAQPQPTARPQPRPQPQAQAAPQEPQQADQWYVQTNEGAEYGPVTRAELEHWITEDRIDAECQVLQDGWEQWKWAEDVFPQMGGGAAEENPFAGIAGGSGVGGSGSFVTPGVESNPYASPQSSGSSPRSDGGVVTTRIVRAIDGARPWLMLFSVLAFISCAGTLIWVIGSFLFMRVSVGFGSVMLIMSLGAMCVSGFIGYLLFTYSKCSGAFVRTRNVSELEKALDAAKSYWKTVGILTLAYFVVALIGGILIRVVFWSAMAAASGA
jgi:hypothetical protein